MTGDSDSMRWTTPAIRTAVLDKQRTSMWSPAQFAEVMGLAGVAPGCRIVDVGAGSGGMLEPFADVLAAHPGASLTCVDREPTLTDATTAKARALGLADRVVAVTGDAAALPLPDHGAELTFCQTVLMHVGAPERVIAELARITRPGGAVVLVEGNAVIRPNLLTRAPVDVATKILRLWHLIRTGRRQLGRGDLAVGEAVPALLAAAGIELVAARLVDRVLLPGPPLLAMLERAEPVFALWRPGFAEAFAAAGGTAAEFDDAWATWRAVEDQQLAEARAGTLTGLLAGLLYVFIGRTPTPA